MNKVCLIPGTFDPVTNGHMYIVKKALEMFDKVYLGILVNKEKETENSFLFTVEQRMAMLQAVFEDNDRIEVLFYDGMTVDLAKKLGAVSVRGLRNEKDFLYEKAMYEYNISLDENFETVYFIADKSTSDISSSKIRQLISEKKEYDMYIPKKAAQYIRQLSVSD